ncbi:MAG: superinfection immunity protein [Candidatus Nomurabacteria bacterium]
MRNRISSLSIGFWAPYGVPVLFLYRALFIQINFNIKNMDIDGISNFLVGIVIFILVLGLYFLPTITAMRRKKKNDGVILLINLLVGWTVVGWLIALVMATSEPSVVVNTSGSMADELEKLHNLKEKGILSEKEFEQKKASLINK